jgi:hypothetical protein
MSDPAWSFPQSGTDHFPRGCAMDLARVPFVSGLDLLGQYSSNEDVSQTPAKPLKSPLYSHAGWLSMICVGSLPRPGEFDGEHWIRGTVVP